MKRKILIVATYVLGLAAIVGGTIVIVAYGNGYSYDLKHRQIIQNGLVILQSTPSGAKVIVDGKDPQKKTPYRNTFAAGEHDFSVTKDGYRPWHKLINVLASQVSLAQYIILFPQHIPVDTLRNYPSADATVPTRDHRRIAINITSGNDTGVWSFDTASHDVARLYTLRAASDTQPVEILRGMEWTDDGSHILLSTAIGETPHFVLATAGGGSQPVDIGETTKLEFTQVHINPQNWRELYGTTTDGLRRIDASAGTASQPLAPTVSSFAFAADRLVYVDTSVPTASLWALERTGRKTQITAALPASNGYSIAYASYLGVGQLAIAPLSTGNAVLYTDPFSDRLAAQPVLLGAQQVSFNGDGHYLVGFDGQTLQSYDVERHTTWRFDTAGQPVHNVSWLDNFHVLYDRDGHTVVSEFDGGNTTIVTKASGLPAFSSGDGRDIIAFQTTSSGTLQIKALRIRQ